MRIDSQEQFIEGIKTAMLSTGVKNSVLAKRMGVTPGYVTQILRGDFQPTTRTMDKLADALGYKIVIHITRK